MQKNIFLMIILLLFFALIFFIFLSQPVLQKITGCSDGTKENSCSITHPFFCQNGKLIKNYSACNCPVDYRLLKGNCFPILCSDKTKPNDCSLTKPFKCIHGSLAEKASECGCPENYRPQGDSCLEIKRCTDGTEYSSCSQTKPDYCNNGNIEQRADICGCPEKQEANGTICTPTLILMEKEIHDLINEQRTANSLSVLEWNDAIANVAREHSNNIAIENISLTDPNAICTYVFIHHEDLNFGLYQDNRLNNRGIYYFGASGENIFADPTTGQKEYNAISHYSCTDVSGDEEPVQGETQEQAIQRVLNGIIVRSKLAADSPRVIWIKDLNKTKTEMEQEIVQGWMNSPGHRANILTPQFNEAGIGIAQVNEYLIVTQVFIQKVDCGFKTGACCKEAGYYDYCYIPLTCTQGSCQ